MSQALDWAVRRRDDESESLAYGQLAVTYQKGGDEQTALKYYNLCKEKSGRVDNIKLELDCLMNSLNIRETGSVGGQGLEPPGTHEYLEALEYARLINDPKVENRCKVSMAIMQGQQEFDRFKHQLLN